MARFNDNTVFLVVSTAKWPSKKDNMGLNSAFRKIFENGLTKQLRDGSAILGSYSLLIAAQLLNL